MKRKHVIAIAIVLLILFSVSVPVVLQVTRNNSIVGPKNPEDSKGVVRTPPVKILAAVNAARRLMNKPAIDLDTLALARAIRSEHGSEPIEVKTWVAWAIKNSARKAGMSVFKRLTDSKSADSRGLFARQRTDARYAATNQDARANDIEIAERVMNSDFDPTNGATNFFSPKTQDALFKLAQAGDTRYVGRITRDAAATRKLWESRGLVSRGSPPGIDSGIVEFFG